MTCPDRHGGRGRGAGVRRRPTVVAVAAAALAVALAMAWGCSPSVEDAIARLADPQQREAARQELLLAKDYAVGPLLEALEDRERAAVRPLLIDVLAGLSLRVEDPRIEAALARHLVEDPDPRVRARIAHMAGVHRRLAMADALLESGLHDGDADVVLQSLIALGTIESRLSEAQEDQRQQTAMALLQHDDERVRWEARLLVETRAATLVDEGRALVLQAQVAQAETLFHKALTIVPDSKYANYRLARLALDQGQRERGLQLLREQGMLLDVPRLARPPTLDGRLDDEVWATAARARGFYIYTPAHKAALPSGVNTEICVTYTDAALWIGFIGHDEHLDSLVVKTHDEDGGLWWEDIIEIYLDADLDHRSYVHMGINSIGVVSDAWHPNGLGGQDEGYDVGARVAARVGEEGWYLEVAIPFGDEHLPAPRPGDAWGFNLVRTYRGSEFSQWVRTYTGAHAPDEFGVLLFQ